MRVWPFAFLALAGCTTIPPAPAPTRAPSPVAASFDRTWSAAVDIFAEKNIGIRTIDRASGLIVGDPMSVEGKNTTTPYEFADCGQDMFEGHPWPTVAIYNVRVKGDTAASTILVSVRWLRQLGGESLTCTSKGVWESQFEESVRTRAQAAK